MPIYEYQCKSCHREFEYQQRMSDPEKTLCESCGTEALERIISRTAFQLKGSGWYKDLYSSSKPEAKPSADASSSTGSDSSSAAAPSTSSDSSSGSSGAGTGGSGTSGSGTSGSTSSGGGTSGSSGGSSGSKAAASAS